jgi:hypothetical protein
MKNEKWSHWVRIARRSNKIDSNHIETWCLNDWMIEWLNDCCYRFWRQTLSFRFVSTRNDKNLSQWSFSVNWHFKTELRLEWNHLLEDIARSIVFTIDQFLIFTETIEECMIKIDLMTNKTLIEVLMLIKNARHIWYPESHRALSSRSENSRTWELENLRTWGSEDLRIIILMSVSEARVGKIIIQNIFLIHDVTFNSNDLRYLSCRGDFNSSRSINSGPRW